MPLSEQGRTDCLAFLATRSRTPWPHAAYSTTEPLRLSLEIVSLTCVYVCPLEKM